MRTGALALNEIGHDEEANDHPKDKHPVDRLAGGFGHRCPPFALEKAISRRTNLPNFLGPACERSKSFASAMGRTRHWVTRFRDLRAKTALPARDELMQSDINASDPAISGSSGLATFWQTPREKAFWKPVTSCQRQCRPSPLQIAYGCEWTNFHSSTGWMSDPSS